MLLSLEFAIDFLKVLFLVKGTDEYLKKSEQVLFRKVVGVFPIIRLYVG